MMFSKYSPLPSNLDLNELNQFYARFDTTDFSTETEDQKMELNVSKNVDECLVNQWEWNEKRILKCECK